MKVDSRVYGIGDTTNWICYSMQKTSLHNFIRNPGDGEPPPYELPASSKTGVIEGVRYVAHVVQGYNKVVMVLHDDADRMRILSGSFEEIRGYFPMYAEEYGINEGIVFFADDLPIHEIAPIDNFYHVKARDQVSILVDYTGENPEVIFA